LSERFGYLRRRWPTTEPVFRWGFLVLLGTLLFTRLVAEVQPSGDTKIYRNAGEAILAGQVPYQDFLLEYPPGALPIFVLPALYSSEMGSYITLFAAEMALLLVATLFLTTAAARRFGVPWLLPALVVAAGVVLLTHLANARYDPVVAFVLSGAVWATAACRPNLAWPFLGFGTLAKITPVLATAALYPLRQGRLRGTLTFVGILLAGFVPAFLASPSGFSNVFSYHAERGLQMESFVASILLKLEWVEGIAYRYGAVEVVGGLAEVAATATLLITLALLFITCAVIWREARHGCLGARQFPRYAAALLLAFMVGSKVLSPQYMLWLLPLVPLAYRGAWNLGVSAVFLVACWSTHLVLSAFYGAALSNIYTDESLVLDSQRYLALISEESFYGIHPLDILLVRNTLLLVLWLAMLVIPARGETEYA